MSAQIDGRELMIRRSSDCRMSGRLAGERCPTAAHLLGQGTEDGRPGLAVTEVPAGVLVRWTASNGFASLAKEQRGTSGDNMQAIVQAAVSGLLLQLGHTVTELSEGGDLLILADGRRLPYWAGIL